MFADPARVHPVQHEGRHYQVDAIHLSEPSPQRTPVLYQAGASARGTRVRRRPRRVRLRQRPVPPQRARHRRRHPRAGESVRPRSARHQGVRRRQRRRRADRGRGARQAGGIPRLRQLGGRAGALLGLGRRRFLALRSRRTDPLCQDQRDGAPTWKPSPCAAAAPNGRRESCWR